MTYRTKTYIAGDWTNDKEAIEKLYEWNHSKYWGLTFNDAHEITQAKDTSLNCSIKQSLKIRLDASKTFVLIVGEKTKDLRSGACYECPSYNSWAHFCARGRSVSFESYIDYECRIAKESNLRTIVLYNDSSVKKERCPEILRSIGNHIEMYHWQYLNGSKTKYWNYDDIKHAIMPYNY